MCGLFSVLVLLIFSASELEVCPHHLPPGVSPAVRPSSLFTTPVWKALKEDICHSALIVSVKPKLKISSCCTNSAFHSLKQNCFVLPCYKALGWHGWGKAGILLLDSRCRWEDCQSAGEGVAAELGTESVRGLNWCSWRSWWWEVSWHKSRWPSWCHKCELALVVRIVCQPRSYWHRFSFWG